MKTGLIAGIALCCAATRVWAGSYSDFNAGLAANERGDSDTAIASLTHALEAGDLAGSLKPSALIARGIAYNRKERWLEAKSDLEAALKLKPEALEAYLILAEAQEQLKQYDAALDNFRHALSRGKQSAGGYMTLAHLEWNSGRFRDAAEDTERAEQLGARTQYDALWEVIAHTNAGMDVRTAWLANPQTLANTNWPRPIVDVYLQRAKPEDARMAAQRGARDAINGQICEADFYLAELQREHHDLTGAKSGFADAVKICPHHFVEYNAAQAALDFPPQQTQNQETH